MANYYDSVDPNDPNGFNFARLPVPATSPQFQSAQVAPGQGAIVGPDGQVILTPNRMIAGWGEQQGRGPMLLNQVPPQGDTGGWNTTLVSDPSVANSGQAGEALNAVQPVTPQAMPQRATGVARQMPQDPPTGYTSFPPQAAPQDAPQAPQAPTADTSGGFLGINSLKDLGRKLEHAAAWIAPPGNASAALGMRNSDDAAAQKIIDNARNVRLDQFKDQANVLALQKAQAPDVKVETSANGKFRVITATNPLTGEVSFRREAIPDDEQSATGDGKDPSGIIQRDLTKNQQQLASNDFALHQIDETLGKIEKGETNFSAIAQGSGALGNFLGSSSQNSRNIAQANRLLESLVEERIKQEPGGGSNEKLHNAMRQVMPQGSAKYDTRQWEEAIRQERRYIMERSSALADGTASTMRNNTRLAGDVDPATGKPRHEGFSATAARIRADQEEREKAWADRDRANGVTATTSPQQQMSSPLLRGLQDRYGQPGAR